MAEALNASLLARIETELKDTTQSNYYKNISIQEYNYKTKLTLDLLVEKYGGYIYREDNQITLFINFSNLAPRNQATINLDLYNKLEMLKQQLDQIQESITEFKTNQSLNYFSYLDYFDEADSLINAESQLQSLINEIIEHEKGE